MQEDFHYYATYCAALIAGYSADDSREIAYSAQLVDHCSETLLRKLKAPIHAATTQLQLEMMNHRTDLIGLQNITRIWASFHFLPKDLYSECKPRSKRYRDKFHLICGPNGELVKETVELAKKKNNQAVGIAMHVLADTWAHRNFVGTPSFVFNNVTPEVYEILDDEDRTKKVLTFGHNVSTPDSIEKRLYTNTVFQPNENTVMNLGHGRAGHLPDYSFIHYQYMPAWADYEMVDKDNPKEYYQAFCQMVYAMQYLRGQNDMFELDKYAYEEVEPYRTKIEKILKKRQTNACDDWKQFGIELSGAVLEDFDVNKYQNEYENKENAAKNSTFLGRFIIAALAHKSMITNRIFKSKNLLAGYSVDYTISGFKGIRDYFQLLEQTKDKEKS